MTAAPLFVWFQQEAGMDDTAGWPDDLRPLAWEDSLVNGWVVISDEPPGTIHRPTWCPKFVGPMPLSCGEKVAETLGGYLRSLGLVVSTREVEDLPKDRAVGHYRSPLAIGVYGRTPVFAVRPLPAHIPNPNGRTMVQALVNAIGGPAWINADADDVKLD